MCAPFQCTSSIAVPSQGKQVSHAEVTKKEKKEQTLKNTYHHIDPFAYSVLREDELVPESMEHHEEEQ